MVRRNVVLILLIVLSVVGSAVAQQVPQTSTSEAIIVRVDGASCPFCAFGLEKRLGRLTGVQDVNIELKAGNAIVRLKEGASVSEAALRQAVKDAGFTAREITFPPGMKPAPAE